MHFLFLKDKLNIFIISVDYQLFLLLGVLLRLANKIVNT